MVSALRTFSDAGFTTPDTTFVIGDTVYMDGDLTANDAENGVTVKIEAKSGGVPGAGVVKATPVNLSHNFPDNTVQNIKTNINSGTVVEWDSSGQATGQYHFYITITGTNIGTRYITVPFELVSAAVAPTVGAPTLSDTTIAYDESVTVTSTITDRGATGFGGVKVNDVFIALLENTAGDVFAATFYGADVGVVTAGTVTAFWVNTTDNMANDTNSVDTLTVARNTYTGSQLYKLASEVKDNIEDGVDTDWQKVVPAGSPAYGGTDTGEDFGGFTVFADELADVSESKYIEKQPYIRFHINAVPIDYDLEGKLYRADVMFFIVIDETHQKGTMTKFNALNWYIERLGKLLEKMVITSVMMAGKRMVMPIGPAKEDDSPNLGYAGEIGMTFEFKEENV